MEETSAAILAYKATQQASLEVDPLPINPGGAPSVVSIEQSFSFEQIDETSWFWGAQSVLALTGGVDAPIGEWGPWTTLEIGGTDLGTDPDNHTGDPVGFDNNFDLSILRIDPGAHGYLEDLFDNGNRNGPFGQPEALYVDTLEFSDTAGLLNLNGLHLYFGNLIGNPSQIIDEIVALPGIESVVTVNYHTGIGLVGSPVDVAASVGVDSGAVATESRTSGVTRLEITFADALDPSVGALNEAAVMITPDPAVGITTSLTNSDLTLVLDFDAPWPNEDTYTVALTDSVIAAATATAGDRDFELRALLGNVAHESGAGPQEVNALDLGLAGGIRGKFTADVSDPANARFDVTQDGSIDALDLSCVRLTCGVFATTAP